MEVPRQRLEGEAAPTYAAKCDFFTVEIILGGFFSGSGQNRSYLDGKKICYDYCHIELAYYKMFEALIEDIGYEKGGRIDIYWLPPVCQLNEDGARLLSNDADIDPMYVNINLGHRFHMIYLDHLDSHISGGGAAWDDVVANPRSQVPAVFSPKKKLSKADQSMVSCSVVEESNEIQSNEQVHVRLRPKRQKLEDEPEEYSDSDSDSVYIPEIVDSDYDLEDGDDDLAQEQLDPLQDKKGKKVVEECNSEDDTLDAPDSDEEDMKFNFKSFTPADMHDPKFHAGQLFSSVELLRKAIREYSCKERVNITFPKNDKGRLGAKCEKGCPWYLYASWDNRTNAIMIKTFNGVHNCSYILVCSCDCCLLIQRESRQRNEVEQGPLPENAFIQQQSQSQQPVVQSTATKGGDVHRKREVVAIARLRAAAERREIADQAKFDAAIAKLKEEEEEEIKLAAQKKKEELLGKKQAAEDKKKVLLEEKKLAAEQKKKASEEKKRKALEEKLAMADKRREAMEQRKRNAEEAKRLKAEEKQRISEERKRIATTKYEEAEAMFLLHQSDEMERRKSFLETHEAARQQAWEQQSIQQAAARAKEDLQEKNRREAELANQARDEEERLNACQHMTKACKRTGPSSSQTMRGFKQPRKVNMFDELRGG